MAFNSNSIEKIKNKVEVALDYGKVNQALRYIYDCVERIITEPLCVAHVFGSRELDELCTSIGRKNILSIKKIPFSKIPYSIDTPTIVYIVSRLQRSGGHSRLIQAFIKAQPNKFHLILSTEVCGPSDIDYLDKVFGKEKSVSHLRAPKGDLAYKLSWLQSILLTLSPEHVNLLNHHQDCVAIAALVPELGLCGTFYHHGDHHLCLGVFIDNLTHVDLHPVGYHVCRDELGISNKYLPLTFEDRGALSMNTDFMRGGALTTATAARSNKVEIPYYVSYLELIPKLLETTGGRHLHVGKLSHYGLCKLRKQLSKRGIDQSRFIYVEWVPSVSKALEEHSVDLYLSSFPYGAGLTLIEVMGLGIPVVMHRHMYSKVLSALELAYCEAFNWETIDELLDYLKNIKPAELKKMKIYARERYERSHKPQILQEYFKNPDLHQIKPPPLIENYKSRSDEWALWMENQLCFSRLFYRFFYRVARRLRNALV